MSFITRLLKHQEPEVNDPIDTPLPLAETYEPRDLGRIEFPTMRRATRTFTHKHHDGFGEPLHDWKEKRVQVIEATCTECGHVELHQDHRGRLKGSKVGKYVKAEPQRNAEWKGLYESGLKVAEIAAQYGVKEDSVYYAFRKMNLKMDGRSRFARKGPAEPSRDAEMVRLRVEEHLTYEQIGTRFGVSRERVRQCLRRSGLDMHAVDEERRHLVSKKHQPKPPSICRYCGTDYTAIGWTLHQKAARHNPNPDADLYAERDRLVAADYAAGMKTGDIMAKYGNIPASAVSRAIARQGVPRRRPNTAFLKTKPEIEARKAAIVEDARSGMGQKEIAEKHGVSTAWVSIVAKGAGIDTAKFHKSTPEERAIWVEQWRSGRSKWAIAQEFGRSDSAINRAIREAGATR